MTTLVRPVQLADIERRARAAITDRLGHHPDDTTFTVTRDREHDDAAVLSVDSGGNALACTQALRAGAGYTCELLPSPGGSGMLLRVLPGDPATSELFTVALALFRSFTPTPYDQDLTAHLLPVLREVAPPYPTYRTQMDAFAALHEDRLQHLYDRFGHGTEFAQHGRYALARQPEGLIVIERLENARHDLLDAFDGEIEGRYLTDIAKAWGVRV